mgnify:CR=1 FL=1
MPHPLAGKPAPKDLLVDVADLVRSVTPAKIRALRAPSEGKLGQAAEAIRDLEEEAAPEQPPLAVKELPELLATMVPRYSMRPAAPCRTSSQRGSFRRRWRSWTR